MKKNYKVLHYADGNRFLMSLKGILSVSWDSEKEEAKICYEHSTYLVTIAMDQLGFDILAKALIDRDEEELSDGEPDTQDADKPYTENPNKTKRKYHV